MRRTAYREPPSWGQILWWTFLVVEGLLLVYSIILGIAFLVSTRESPNTRVFVAVLFAIAIAIGLLVTREKIASKRRPF